MTTSGRSRCATLMSLMSLATFLYTVEELPTLTWPGIFHAQARYRCDALRDDTKPEQAIASTLRTALSYETASWNGLQGMVELFSVNVIGNTRYNWVGNPRSNDPQFRDYPQINDPENAGFSQCYAQWKTNDDRWTLRTGRQLVTLNDEQWLTASRYRQNQNVVDASWMTIRPMNHCTVEVGYLWANRDVFARYQRLNGMVGNMIYVIPDIARIAGYGIWTNYVQPELDGNDLQTIGMRGENEGRTSEPWQILYAVDVAAQSPAFDNPSTAHQASWYGLVELGLRYIDWSMRCSITHRDGTSADHDVIKSPLGYPYPYRGETEQFVGTPVDGVRIYAVRCCGPLPGARSVRLSLFAWDYRAVESAAHYGSEGCVQLDYTLPFMKSWTCSIKAAHFYDADEDTSANPTYGKEQSRLIGMTTITF